MAHEKMFRVIVLGGVALVGPTSCALAVAPIDADAAVDSGFPGELPVQVDVVQSDTGTRTDAARDAADVFPHTMPVLDSGLPMTLPVVPDAGDADADAGCILPIETAIAPDC